MVEQQTPFADRRCSVARADLFLPLQFGRPTDPVGVNTNVGAFSIATGTEEAGPIGTRIVCRKIGGGFSFGVKELRFPQQFAGWFLNCFGDLEPIITSPVGDFGLLKILAKLFNTGFGEERLWELARFRIADAQML